MQWRIALQSLRMNRVRTGLTTLGIIIGVASITLVLSLGGGAESTVRQQVARLGNNVILVKSGYSSSRLLDMDSYNPYGIAITTSLTERDLNSIEQLENIDKVAPIMILDGSVKKVSDGALATAPIIATKPALASIIGLGMSSGQFIDQQTTRDTAVVGHALAIELFGSDQILGQQILVKGRTHTIVGVVKQIDAPINLSGLNLDRTVYISFDDGKSLNQGIAQVQQVIVTTQPKSSPETVQRSIDAVLGTNHSGERDYTVLAGQAIAEPSDALFRTIILLTSLVATITLVVGGIGIMNIMLVGVSERTREIGIRKALGATNRHILGQFLLEALIMCVTGGVIGLAVAYGLAFFLAIPLSFQPAVTWQITAIGFGMALGTGILFGLYPAVKAARKDPIDSLKQYQ
ncbi:MAG TPA: ABC transporter permease [Candidatus Saccharibacteria bacterium]|nr:ABC transporter permease [Candidatus Saccharibacteria bacterium]